MKRSEKVVLSAIMERPSSLSDLRDGLRLSYANIEAALNSLLKAGCIHYVAGKYCINKVSVEKPVSKLVLVAGKLVEERGEGLLEEAAVVKDKPIAAWLKNPPQPEPRWLKERKTRRRDRL